MNELHGYGLNDTIAVQEAINTGDIKLVGEFMIDTAQGIKIPSFRTIDAREAIFRALPGGTPRCKMFETVVGAEAIRFWGGEINGDTGPFTGLQWRIGFRIDGAHGVELNGTRFIGWRTDGIWVGGNAPSTSVKILNCSISYFGRNGLSVVNAEGVCVEHCFISDSLEGADPGAGVDVEPNPLEQVRDLVLYDVRVARTKTGLYLQQGRGLPGERYLVTGCRVEEVLKYGIVMNATIGGDIVNNFVKGAPIGISIGGFNESARATDVLCRRNDVEATRAILLAGVRDTYVFGNNLHGKRVEPVGLGVAGDCWIKEDR